MDLMSLLNQVKQAIFNDPTTPHREGHDPSGLIGQIEGMFGQHQRQYQNRGQVLPASQDPYGDPADMGRGSYAYAAPGMGNVRPASEDPLGDPADQQYGNQGYRNAGYGNQPSRQQFPNLRPASEDPLGDPADQ